MILLKLEALRFGHVDHENEGKTEKFNPFHFDWNQMIKPPIVNLLHPKSIDDMHSLVEDPKLMNDPVKKYKYMNDILRPMGFRPAASGTNRRAFYCEYDPTIILKIGSDRVGRTDNISEFYSQAILKPFCTKIYDVLPTGVFQLCERAEPMKEEDFKKRWSKEIFDLIMNLLYRGYMLEDVGGNFYKNWAIRLGFGPVIIDFPYVYEVDFSKLKCVYVDPRTHKKCDGELDYDYKKGMSEIICDKCGSRYSAQYLAKNISDTMFRKGKNSMKHNFGIALVRGNKIEYQNYVEDNVPFIPANKPEPPKNQYEKTSERITRLQEVSKELNLPIVTDVQKEVPKTEEPPKVEVKETPKQRIIKADINYGKSRSGERFGVGLVRTTQSNKKNNKYNNNQSTNRQYGREPLRDELLPLTTEFLDKVNSEFGRGAAIELCRRLGLYWKDKNDRVDGLIHNIEKGYNQKVEKEESKKNEQKSEPIRSKSEDSQGDTPSKQDEPVVEQPTVTAEDQARAVGASETKSESKEEEVITNKAQTEGLFPVKPMTAEEIEAADLKAREDNSAMGFPGEPVVYTMRMNQKVPELKNLINDTLSGKFELSEDPGVTIRYLTEEISKLVSSEIARLAGTDEAGIEVMVNQATDHMNQICFVVAIENRKSPVLDTLIYPATKDDKNQINVSARHIAEGINPLENSQPTTPTTTEGDTDGEKDIEEYMWLVVEENLSEMKKEPNETAEKSFMVDKLLVALKDGMMHQAEANTRAFKFVNDNYPFTQGEL